jgi:hypothetical protein
MKALDLEAVQAFVLAADLKSFTRAARSSFPWTEVRFLARPAR